MFSSLLRSLPQLGRRWNPLDFSNPNFVRIPERQKIEEETLPYYTASQYYPTRIGEVIKERYQVIGKLGFGSTSTAWLARDMNERRYVMLKIFVQAASMGQHVDNEVNMYRHIKADNIMFGIRDDSVFTDFEESELQHPVPRKEVDKDGRIIYTSQELKVPKRPGAPVLCDFGSAMVGDFLAPDLLTDQIPLEERETTLEGSVEREAFLRFMRKMLQWEPGKRSSAKELAEDEWIHSHM
ncbi:hypothetical protein N7519_004249 [Penicillium mononematosum]|uniref:uncharacterized protein n=1 Tax=Penicillium mononematosum TaxID=268346 RepID=UPI0025477638|nr:uncharacterized protein N7519_004249 [Penicillium mononematosum]KAJ6189341.1 hypothetical protein N7519_004249 [Penicillium mononematosum]